MGRELDDPVLETRRLAALRHVRQLGDPALRTPAAPVTTFDQALSDEAAEMVSVMHDARGVGLAAPQMGRLRRLIVIDPHGDTAPIALVNPEITWRSDDEEIGPEGCLSIGEISVDVPRAIAIRLTAQDVQGNPLDIEAQDFTARVIQHEIDHLDGILILDRTTPDQRKEALRELREAATS